MASYDSIRSFTDNATNPLFLKKLSVKFVYLTLNICFIWYRTFADKRALEMYINRIVLN